MLWQLEGVRDRRVLAVAGQAEGCADVPPSAPPGGCSGVRPRRNRIALRPFGGPAGPQAACACSAERAPAGGACRPNVRLLAVATAGLSLCPGETRWRSRPTDRFCLQWKRRSREQGRLISPVKEAMPRALRARSSPTGASPSSQTRLAELAREQIPAQVVDHLVRATREQREAAPAVDFALIIDEGGGFGTRPHLPIGPHGPVVTLG